MVINSDVNDPRFFLVKLFEKNRFRVVQLVSFRVDSEYLNSSSSIFNIIEVYNKL